MARARPPSKLRRAAVFWDHRRDKYMLLAIFSQLNIRSLNFKQLADTLGSETYSVETLRRRFRELRQMATEVMEDRHDRQLEEHEQAGTAEDSNFMVVDEPALHTSAPSPNTPSPQPSERRGVEPTPPISNVLTPSQRPAKKRAQTEPPPSTTGGVSKKSRKDRDQLFTPKPSPKPLHRDQGSTGDFAAPASSPNDNALNHTRGNKRQKKSKHKSQAPLKEAASDARPKEHLPPHPAQAPTPPNNPTFISSDNSSTTAAKATDQAWRSSVRDPGSTLPSDKWAFGPPPTGPTRTVERAYGGSYPGQNGSVFPSVYEMFP
ncbi:uncharacterized protein BDV17DRAFT_290878 [Aspergillus undulatus]|uniref:uncharacterized protein n=1 Tax=Aspergillus undulatus TaxID=1810928 RepID=UPI003CCCF144